jgi:hypothetical protein
VQVGATTGDVMVGPIPDAYIDSDGYAHITWDAVSGVTVAAIRLPRLT